MAMNDELKETGADAGTESVAPLARHFLWVDSKAGVDRFIRGLVYVCVVLFLIDIIWNRYTKVPGEGLWGFYAIVGFVAFSLIVIGARFLRVFIRRDESFYGDAGVDGEEYPEAGTSRVTHADFQPDGLQDLGEQMLGRESTKASAGSGGASS